MDINTPICNPNLVNAIIELQQNKKEDLFWMELNKALFLCPINIEKSTDKSNTITVSHKNTNIQFLSLTNKKQQHFLMAFTDWSELKKWDNNRNQKVLVFSYKDFQKVVLKNEVYQGIVINPYGENLVINKDLMSKPQTDKYLLRKGQSVWIGLPKEASTYLTDALIECFQKISIIEKAYLLWIAYEEEANYLLVIDAPNLVQEYFPLIGQYSHPFLSGKNMDIILTSSSFGKNAIEGFAPFYTR